MKKRGKGSSYSLVEVQPLPSLRLRPRKVDSLQCVDRSHAAGLVYVHIFVVCIVKTRRDQKFIIYTQFALKIMESPTQPESAEPYAWDSSNTERLVRVSLSSLRATLMGCYIR